MRTSRAAPAHAPSYGSHGRRRRAAPRLGELDVRLGARPPDDGPVEGALTVNAHLACWEVVRALEAGTDIVITDWVTDAGVVVGAWRPGWDALAEATVAGHLLAFGTQSTGGNFSFFG